MKFEKYKTVSNRHDNNNNKQTQRHHLSSNINKGDTNIYIHFAENHFPNYCKIRKNLIKRCAMYIHPILEVTCEMYKLKWAVTIDSTIPAITVSCGALLTVLAVVYTNRLYCGDNAARFFGRTVRLLVAFSGPYNIIVLP